MTNTFFKISTGAFKMGKPTFRVWLKLRMDRIWLELPNCEARIAQLALMTNLPVELVTEYINGPLLPLRSEMQSICAALGYTVDQVSRLIYRADDDKPMWRVLPPKRKVVARPQLVKPQREIVLNPKLQKRLTNRQVDAAIDMAHAEGGFSMMERIYGKEGLKAELKRMDAMFEEADSRKRPRKVAKQVPEDFEALREEHARCSPLANLGRMVREQKERERKEVESRQAAIKEPIEATARTESFQTSNAVQKGNGGLCHVRRTLPR